MSRPSAPSALHDRVAFAARAQDALQKATAALAGDIPGRRPDTELASGRALIG